jgi:cobalt/nickel transport system permease protein
MHMADALVSPLVGAAFWVVSGTLISYSAKKIAKENDPIKTPLMGVLGAFVFAAQMINFSIPGTGSSGHIGGGLLLAVLLGPYRAFIALASVLIIQCLFFADGGLLALGCNMFNLAFFPAFIAYPFIYRVIASNSLSPGRLAAGSITAAAAGLLMGSFSVIIQTVLSGITELPFSTFMTFMLPIHLAIGIVEGLITWAVLSFVSKTEPGILSVQQTSFRPRFIFAAFTIAALMVGGVGSWFASSHPDGLEWSMAKVRGKKELHRAEDDKIHHLITSIQKRIAFLSAYTFTAFEKTVKKTSSSVSPVNAEQSASGIIGTLSVLLIAGGTGLVLGNKHSPPKHS